MPGFLLKSGLQIIILIKMKKSLFLLSSLLSFNLSLLAQEPSVIREFPEDANGYLILNKADYPTVKSWDVTIYKKVQDPTTGDNSLVTLSHKRLLGVDYDFVDPQYDGSPLVFGVIGYDADGNVVANPNDNVIDPDDVNLTCEWVCNGPNYAYALDFYSTQDGGGGNIMMASPPKPIDADYYYEWVSADDWTTFKQNNSTVGYNVFGSFEYDQHCTNCIIRINVPSGQYKYDRFGVAMSGIVYGVAKGFGPYYYHSPYTSDPLTDDETICGYTISYPMQQVNSAIPSSWPQLECNGHSFNTAVDVEEPYAEVADPIGHQEEPCYKTFYYNLGSLPAAGVGGVFMAFQVPCNDVMGYAPQSSGVGISWPANVLQVNVVKVGQDNSGSTQEPITLFQSDLFDANGNFIGAPYSMSQGLYNVQYVFSDLSIKSFYLEIPEDMVSTVEDKDFLSYTAYPVPIQDNQFTMSYEATQQLNFTYELRDFNGNLLYSENYKLAKDQVFQDLIAVPDGIPSGILFNTLVFEDGSSIAFQTMK